MNKEMADFVEEMKKMVKTPQVDVIHIPTANECNNLCYLSMKYIMSWPMRQADFAVCMLSGTSSRTGTQNFTVAALCPCSFTHMMGTPKTMGELDEKFIPVVAEYMWDHLMGEPDDPTVDDLVVVIRVIRDILFGMDETTRNAIEKQ